MEIGQASKKPMEYTDADRLLDPSPMMIETGVERLESGGLRVAVRTDMPGCSGAMFDWWFGSAPDTERYVWWHPADHVQSDWLEQSPGKYIGSTHVVKERLAGSEEVHNLQIHFIEPTELFDSKSFNGARDAGDVSVAVCAMIGIGEEPNRDEQGRPANGRMVHLGRDNQFGLVLRSSFWLGAGVDAPPEALRELIPDELGLSLLQHAHTEWKLLARFLPSLYAAEVEGERTAIPW
jgi:DAPG hydrolase PhiG domain